MPAEYLSRYQIWYLKNKDKASARNKAYYLKNKEVIRKRHSEWKASNPDKISTQHRAYYEERKDEICRQAREKRRTYDYAAYKRAYRLKNRQKMNDQQRARKRKEKYGISPEQFDEQLKKQNGKCACCGDALNLEARIAVDHSHITGHIRGILCFNCNLAEGLVRTPEGAKKLFLYMSKEDLFYSVVAKYL